ncbi:MAG: hypothetical protein ACI81I_000075 [Arcobacteraceae bacterium]|jgi:hypothetical protein
MTIVKRGIKTTTIMEKKSRWHIDSDIDYIKDEISAGTRIPNSNLFLENYYEKIIYDFLLLQAPQRVEEKISCLQSCLNAGGIVIQENVIYAKGYSTGLNNAYEIEIFKLLKENHELKLTKDTNKNNIICCGSKMSDNEPLIFYLPNGGNYQKLKGSLEIEGLKSFKSYNIIIEEI